MAAEQVIVVSDQDPVAARVVAQWGVPPATGLHVDGAPLRRLSAPTYLLRRSGLPIHDERLDLRLPTELREQRVTLIFPSIHRSEQNIPCLTVHPLGNPGPEAELGGRPRILNPTDPRRMVATLRALHEAAPGLGLDATYEATHHGPSLALPSYFVEIGFGAAALPPEGAVRLLASILPGIEPSDGDRVALAIGGGHYAPHFTDLALRRRWAFGHILPRHALGTLDATTARSAWENTHQAEGILYARAEDAGLPGLGGLGPRLRDPDASRRERPSVGAQPAAGT